MPIILPLAVLGLMLTLNPVLRIPATWDRMARNWTGEALLAAALTPIIVTGGIDLSVGSVVGLSAVVAGFLWREAGLPIEIALAGSLLAGMTCGAMNGALVLTGINPLVVTLATLAVFRGLAYGISGQRLVADFPPGLEAWWEANTLGLPRPLWIIAFAFVLGYVFLHHTWMGRMLFAMGDNVRAARFAGVPIRALTFSLYVCSGLVAGIVGMTTILKSLAAPPSQGEEMELRAIACVVLGGVRITGGWGTMLGTLLGTLTLATLLEGMVWVPGEFRLICTGGFLVAVAIANEALARWRTRTEIAFTRVSAPRSGDGAPEPTHQRGDP
jgi:rhamnose transport system permease protein